MSITVEQASEFLNKRQDLREKQERSFYKDLVFYCEVKDFNELARCSAISNMEEWLLSFTEDQTADTALLVSSENEKIFTLTSFVTQGAGVTPTVVQTPLSKDSYLHLRTLGKAGYCYRRNRFDIPYTPDAWLVDIYYDYSGKEHPWVRVTLALNSDNNEFPKLPFKVVESIYESDPENTQQQIDKIKNLWKNEWCMIEKA